MLFGRWITRPIVKTSARIKEISESLDLSTRVDVAADNEVGMIARSFNNLLDVLQSIITHVDSSVIEINAESRKLATSTDKAQEWVQNQEEQTEKVATSMTELSSVVDSVAHNADQAASATAEASEKAREGKSVVDSTAAVIGELATGVQSATEAIQRVGQDSHSINSVLEVIRGIAEQTNLLALNAAIEAARAGDQGRGFAVVADEVRSLASRTQESTEEIQQTIEHLQNGVELAIQAIERGRDQANDSVQRAMQAGESLSAISQVVEKINQMNAEISLSFQEQAQATGHISDSVLTISDLSEQALHDAQNNAASSENLSRLSDHLKQQIGQFKL